MWRLTALTAIGLFAAGALSDADAQRRSYSSRHEPNAAQGLESAGRGGLHVGRSAGTGGLSKGRTTGTGGIRGRRTTKADDLATPDAPEVYVPPHRRRVR